MTLSPHHVVPFVVRPSGEQALGKYFIHGHPSLESLQLQRALPENAEDGRCSMLRGWPLGATEGTEMD